MWNLEKMTQMAFFQSRTIDLGAKNKFIDTSGEKGEWNELGDWIDMYTLLILCGK